MKKDPNYSQSCIYYTDPATQATDRDTVSHKYPPKYSYSQTDADNFPHWSKITHPRS
jgi:hypothetical protein